MADGSKIPDLNAVRGEIGAKLTAAQNNNEVVSSLDLLEHDSDPQAHGGSIAASTLALARMATATTHSEVSSADGGNTYTSAVTWYPAQLREYSARVYARAKAAGRSFVLTVTMPQAWINLHGVYVGYFDYNSADTHVKVNAANNSNQVTLEITRDASAAAFAAGDTVVVSLLVRATYS